MLCRSHQTNPPKENKTGGAIGSENPAGRTLATPHPKLFKKERPAMVARRPRRSQRRYLERRRVSSILTKRIVRTDPLVNIAALRLCAKGGGRSKLRRRGIRLQSEGTTAKDPAMDQQAERERRTLDFRLLVRGPASVLCGHKEGGGQRGRAASTVVMRGRKVPGRRNGKAMPAPAYASDSDDETWRAPA